MPQRLALSACVLVLALVFRGRAEDPAAVGPARPTRPAAPTNLAAGVAATATPAAETTNQVEKALELGYRALQTGQTNAAISLFKKVLTLEEKNRRARFGLATVMIQTEQYKDAIALLEPLLVEFPKDYFLKNNLAWILATARDPAVRNGPRAVRLAQEALLFAPNDSHVWSTLAEAYFLCGNYDKAQRSAEQALQLSRDRNMEARLIKDYQQQVERCRKAAEAMSILE